MQAGAGETARPSGRSAPASSKPRRHCTAGSTLARDGWRRRVRRCDPVPGHPGTAVDAGMSGPPVAVLISVTRAGFSWLLLLLGPRCRAAVPAGRSRAGGRCLRMWQQRSYRAVTAVVRRRPSGRYSSRRTPGRLVGLLEAAALTEHVNAMAAAARQLPRRYPAPGGGHGGRSRNRVGGGLACWLRRRDLCAAGTCARW